MAATRVKRLPSVGGQHSRCDCCGRAGVLSPCPGEYVIETPDRGIVRVRPWRGAILCADGPDVTCDECTGAGLGVRPGCQHDRW